MIDPKLNLFIEKHSAAIKARAEQITAEVEEKAKAIRAKVDQNDPDSMMRGVAEVQAVIWAGMKQIADFLTELVIKELVIEPMFEMLKTSGFAPGGEITRKDH